MSSKFMVEVIAQKISIIISNNPLVYIKTSKTKNILKQNKAITRIITIPEM